MTEPIGMFLVFLIAVYGVRFNSRAIKQNGNRHAEDALGYLGFFVLAVLFFILFVGSVVEALGAQP